MTMTGQTDGRPKVDRSPMVLQRLRQGEIEQSELLGQYAAAVRKAQGQLAIRERTTPHTHVGGCASKLGQFRYDPADCDCSGPDLARRHLQLVGELLRIWSDCAPGTRLGVIHLLDRAFEAVGPIVATCSNCNGRGQNPAGLECPTCNATCVVEVLKDGEPQWLKLR